MIKKKYLPLLLLVLLAFSAHKAAEPKEQTSPSPLAPAALRQEVSQYGITWTFDKPARTGQFITGDWWVVGPVRIVKITPEPGPCA